jgi:hypothetical protein
MAMKINARVAGYGPDAKTDTAIVNLTVEFEGTETATFSVLLRNEGDETALCERGKRRAKELAHRFAALP